MFMQASFTNLNRSEGFPARDTWLLHAVFQGSYQMGRVLGTSAPSPPPLPSVVLPQDARTCFNSTPGPNGLGAPVFQVLIQFEGPQAPRSWSKWAGSPQVPWSAEYTLSIAVFGPGPALIISEISDARLFPFFFFLFLDAWNW